MDFGQPVWDARVSMLSTVAVGTDGSTTASKAVDAAVEIAQRFDARLVLLSAFANKGASAEGSDELQWAHSNDARVREMLSRTEQDLRNRKIECTTMLDEGDPAEVLVRLAEECEADLLVIGNRGCSGACSEASPTRSRTRHPARSTSCRRPKLAGDLARATRRCRSG